MEKDVSLENLQIQLCNDTSRPCPVEELVFGKQFTDHMLEIDWSIDEGWGLPRIKPFQNLNLHPAAPCLHYALEVSFLRHLIKLHYYVCCQAFEGLKAYRNPITRKIVLFRPERNMSRFSRSCARLALPQIGQETLQKLICELISVDEKHVPDKEGYSLYIRPFIVGTQEMLGVAPPRKAKLVVICSPVGPYFKDGFVPIQVLVETNAIRAWPHGVGSYKIGGNYAPTLLPQRQAHERGCAQVLWILPDPKTGDFLITEVGTMNLFLVLLNTNLENCGPAEEAEETDIECVMGSRNIVGRPNPWSKYKLVTCPLRDGVVLPGVTRESVIELARTFMDVSEEDLYLHKHLLAGLRENNVVEIFGTGTACVISPVDGLLYEETRLQVPLGENNCGKSKGIGPVAEALLNQLETIQRGQILNHPWTVNIEDWRVRNLGKPLGDSNSPK